MGRWYKGMIASSTIAIGLVGIGISPLVLCGASWRCRDGLLVVGQKKMMVVTGRCGEEAERVQKRAASV